MGYIGLLSASLKDALSGLAVKSFYFLIAYLAVRVPLDF